MYVHITNALNCKMMKYTYERQFQLNHPFTMKCEIIKWEIYYAILTKRNVQKIV